MKGKVKAFAEVIDLDFYRKFRIALPIRINSRANKKQNKFARFTHRRFSRRSRTEKKTD